MRIIHHCLPLADCDGYGSLYIYAPVRGCYCRRAVRFIYRDENKKSVVLYSTRLRAQMLLIKIAGREFIIGALLAIETDEHWAEMALKPNQPTQ